MDKVFETKKEFREATGTKLGNQFGILIFQMEQCEYEYQLGNHKDEFVIFLPMKTAKRYFKNQGFNEGKGSLGYNCKSTKVLIVGGGPILCKSIEDGVVIRPVPYPTGYSEHINLPSAKYDMNSDKRYMESIGA